MRSLYPISADMNVHDMSRQVPKIHHHFLLVGMSGMQYLLSLLLKPIFPLVSSMYMAGMLTQCLYFCMDVPLDCICEDTGLLLNTTRNKWMMVWVSLNNFPWLNFVSCVLIWYYIISYKIHQFCGREIIFILRIWIFNYELFSLVSLVSHLVNTMPSPLPSPSPWLRHLKNLWQPKIWCWK